MRLLVCLVEEIGEAEEVGQVHPAVAAEYNQVSYLLKKMTRKGILVRSGVLRGTFYRLAQGG